MTEKNNNGCAVILGAGARAGTGGAVAALAARKGLHVFIVGRTRDKLDRLAADIEREDGQATPVAADCTHPDGIGKVFKQIVASGLPLRLAVHNMAAPNLPTGFLDTDLEFFETHWRRSTLAGYLAGQAAVKQMLTQDGPHRGTLIFTGASGSMRGNKGFAAFAAAKAGLRAMAQSIAREFGPQGIHVGHIIIDGIIDGQFVRDAGGDVAEQWLESRGKDGNLDPDHIAQAFWAMHSQPLTAWTHELDIRPYKENW